MILLKLFMVFSKIGLFAVGGAYSFLPLVEREVVQNHHWLEESELLDAIGIASIFPGAISIKLATYTGYNVAGIPGAIVANFGNLFAPVLFITLASFAYSKYKDIPFVDSSLKMVQCAVFAMIIAVAARLLNKSDICQVKYLLAIAASFILFFCTRIHPAFIIVGAGLFGALLG